LLSATGFSFIIERMNIAPTATNPKSKRIRLTCRICGF